jgi:hypothetical protein
MDPKDLVAFLPEKAQKQVPGKGFQPLKILTKWF